MFDTNLSKKSLAASVLFALSSHAAHAAQEDDPMIEEVVATASRLQGSAQAVIQERQNQAFVADIMGAEQISRTGDGDAASALRRVTGLTLVDGKFIYVRGLGERYSSTQLNSMLVPSPDPTRSVVPLDLFPSDIIESLSVQKSYSPNMPAHFGGGNVDIRTKSLPSDFIFKVSGGLGSTSKNTEDGYFYEGGADDWKGEDDGTRGLPALFQQSITDNGGTGIEGDRNTTLEERKALLSSINWEIGPEKQSVDPDFGFGVTLGDRIDTEIGNFGFLATAGYDNSWSISDEDSGSNIGSKDRDFGVCNAQGDCFAQYRSGVTTEHNVRWSGMLNLGYEYEGHKIELANIALHDMSDRVRDHDYFDENEIGSDNNDVKALRRIEVLYEEREMFSTQLKGKHNFAALNNSFFDWYLGTSRTSRKAPGSLEATFEQVLENGSVTEEFLQDVSSAKMNRDYQQLHDKMDTWGWNAGIPFYLDNTEIEIKVGGDFSEKQRNASNVSIDILHFGISDEFTKGSNIYDIFSDENIANDDFYSSSTGANIFQDATTDGDAYLAANKIDAFYGMADVFWNNKLRVTGGVRWEEFSQVSVPLQAHTDKFDASTEEIQQTSIKEDDLYPSLALTYFWSEEMQVRFNISETAIRPDFRDVSKSFFIDPLTELLVRGSPTLRSTKLTNVDFRLEWYGSAGNTLSGALFYKDMVNPIELVEITSVGGATPQLLTANAESAELYGIEIEFMQDLSIIDNDLAAYFLSGNLTVSDSNVVIGFDDLDSIFNQQLRAALEGSTVSSNFVTNNERRLIGHSEWVANMQLGWDSDDGEHSASLVYNVFGPRIIVPGTRGNQDAEEQSFHSLDMVYTYYPTFESSVKFKIKNILGEEKEILQQDIPFYRKDKGTEFSVSFDYEF
ncbi:TonB-dependent receptor [Catenovulum agarivorans DS-2]|uniref:TonB-dependent receptor n=1 Tax=Catenovulum agarivorans DS-2 TaxID=1328313 RepID=W7QUH0_9ALTE|nr:TonB-dependent receptor [Catenovulum agarivorans]EWH11508.1 TonB-dependent receptor [Catenovulum agarivorans DS-2]